MSEPDAVPLPREGEVFFDVRGDARTMRLSWYADSKVAVFSIWQGNRCTGTFRLPFTDLARMIETLQAGPHPSYQEPEYPDSGFGDSADYGHSGDYGRSAYDQTYSAGYGPPDYGRSGGDQAYRGYGSDQAPASERGYGREHQEAFGRDRAIGADPGPSYSGRTRPDDQFGGGPEFADRSEYAAPPADPGRPYGLSQPHTTSQPYGEPYGPGQPRDPGQPYDSGPPYGSAEHYRPAEPYRPARPYAPGPSYGSGPAQSSDQPYAAGQHYGAPAQQQQSNYGLPDYDQPNYGDLNTGRDADRPARSDGQLEADSPPDAAMLGFPTVPARNGPYR